MGTETVCKKEWLAWHAFVPVWELESRKWGNDQDIPAHVAVVAADLLPSIRIDMRHMGKDSANIGSAFFLQGDFPHLHSQVSYNAELHKTSTMYIPVSISKRFCVLVHGVWARTTFIFTPTLHTLSLVIFQLSRLFFIWINDSMVSTIARVWTRIRATFAEGHNAWPEQCEAAVFSAGGTLEKNLLRVAAEGWWLDCMTVISVSSVATLMIGSWAQDSIAELGAMGRWSLGSWYHSIWDTSSNSPFGPCAQPWEDIVRQFVMSSELAGHTF